jgi:hypothetical protein
MAWMTRIPLEQTENEANEGGVFLRCLRLLWRFFSVGGVDGEFLIREIREIPVRRSFSEDGEGGRGSIPLVAAGRAVLR